MSSDSDKQREDSSGGFGLQLDEDLLAAALSAVDRARIKRPPGAASIDDDLDLALVEDTDDLDEDFEVELDLDLDLDDAATDDDATDVAATENTATENTATENAATENTATENTATENTATENTATENTATENTATENTATENTATENTATENTAGPLELEQLREAQARALVDLAELEQQATDLKSAQARAAKERRRLLGALRRTEDQLDREQAKLDRERDMRRNAEDHVSQLRRASEQLKAELDQLRERRRRERGDERQHAHSRAVGAILPVLDNLELALEFQHEDPARVVHGVGMIVQQFHQTLTTLGVQRVVSGPGILFDPEVHEAISEVRTAEMLPGSIVEELRPGYVLNGRLLRASRVTVAAIEIEEAATEAPAPEAPAAEDDAMATTDDVPETSPDPDLDDAAEQSAGSVEDEVTLLPDDDDSPAG